jgi:hypothetical protein
MPCSIHSQSLVLIDRDDSDTEKLNYKLASMLEELFEVVAFKRLQTGDRSTGVHEIAILHEIAAPPPKFLTLDGGANILIPCRSNTKHKS